MNLARLLSLLASIASALGASPVFALSTDADQPIRISADSAEMNDTSGVSVYHGKVRVTQGSITLEADTVHIYAPKRAVEKITAEGNLATFRQKADDGRELYGEGEYLEYFAPSDKLILMRRARILDGDNSFASERIEYDRKARVVEAGDPQGGSRVDMTITPRKETKPK